VQSAELADEVVLELPRADSIRAPEPEVGRASVATAPTGGAARARGLPPPPPPRGT